MKFNENIYYYKPVYRAWGSDIFIIKSEDNSSSNFHQYLIEAGGTKRFSNHRKNLKLMEKENIDIRKTEGIFLTHEHPDHAAAVNMFKKDIGKNVPLYFNENYKEFFLNDQFFKQDILTSVGPYMKEIQKVPPDMVEKLFKNIWGNWEVVDNVQGIKEKDRFELGDDSYFEVIESPGHSKAHLSYLVHCANGKKVLLSGDSISYKRLKNETICLASLNTPTSTYTGELSTIKKYLDMDFDIMFTSHYGYVEGKDTIKEYLQKALERIQGFEKEIYELILEKPRRIPELTEIVINKKKIPNYLGGYATRPSTVFVILKHLENQGKIKGDPQTKFFSTN